MSYEIMRDRRFIKIGEDKYIPLILSGANNCTQINYATGREILERNWNIFWGAKDIITTKEQMLDWAKFCIENHSVEYEVEWFKQGGSWVTGEKIFKWIENGCKNAYSIEDYILLARTSLYCEIVLYFDTGDTSCRWERKNRKYIKTTQELLDWIEEYRAFDKGEAKEKYLNISFSGDKPLKIANPTKSSVLDNPYICKVRNQYLTDYNNGFNKNYCLSFSPFAKEAKIFTDKDEFQLVQNVCASCGYPVKAVSAKTVEKVFPYVLKVSEGYRAGYYVKKKTRNHLYYGSFTSDAKKFETEKQAQKYADSIMGRFDGCKNFVIEKVEG